MVKNNKKQNSEVKFVYNKDMENQYEKEVADNWYGDRTFANQRALQSFGQG